MSGAVYAAAVVDKHLDSGFGRDGISGMVSADRAIRAREVSRPDAAPSAPDTTDTPDAPDATADPHHRSLTDRASGRISRRSARPSGSA